jgi:diaminopimelate decarboxylase
MNVMIISETKALELVDKYGSPLYVYDEKILRLRCKELKALGKDKNFKVNYSAKANTNLDILKVVKDEGLCVDAMSPGEIFIEQMAGFDNKDIFYISNNVSKEEMQYAIDRDILISVDSLSQLEMYGQINKGGKVAVRFNSGVGAGHHEKVVTGGKKTKFAVQKSLIPDVKDLLKKYDLKITGINQHIGSFFLRAEEYIDGVKAFLDIAKEFKGLEFVDFGGGFGIPYEAMHRLDLDLLSNLLNVVLDDFIAKYDNKDIMFKIEPGRYIVAECGVLLGTVHSVKDNYSRKYVGTDIGFNVLQRPVMYDSYHHIDMVKRSREKVSTEIVYVCGNICESGDLLAKERALFKADVGDVVAVKDAGAYAFAMASNYNCRLKPAEVLIDLEGNDRLIRKREELADLVRHFDV